MACLQDRRTRRVAQGVSLKAGDMSYESANEPSPLTPLEEAILIAGTGPTGAVMHDGPLDKPSGKPELGTPFLHVTGRAASSADNAQATSMFMINDEGIWLLRRPWEREAMEIFKEIPPRWEDRTEDDWLAYANAVKRKVYDQRFQFPREWPYYLGWNAQHSNAPGHDLLPARRRQHAPVHQRAADPALGAEGQGAPVHGRLAPVPPQGRRRLGRLGRVQGRCRRPDPLPADRRASSACAAAW